MSGRRRLVDRIWGMKNVHRSPYSFAMDLNEIKQTFDQIERKQQQFLGIFHSHPTDIAYPSQEDLLLNPYDDIIHLIVSLASKKPDVRAYRYAGTKVIPYQIHVTGG